MHKQLNPLGFNIGYIIHETPGYTRDFEFEFPFLDLSDDLTAKDFKGKVTFTRTQRGILLHVAASAIVPTICVRCLEATLSSISTEFTELYAFDHRAETESGLIVPENGYIDISPLVREYLILDIPTNPLCKPDCLGLCPVCGENRNEVDCGCDIETIDPRLAKLKDLLDQQEEE